MRSRSWALPALVAVAYLLATIAMTWPLTVRAGSAVQDLGDPLFEIWVMRAVQHQLVSDPLNLYDANVFHPFDLTLAYSEEAISTALLAWPVYLVSGNDILAYNWMVLTSFWLVGFAVYLLARELNARPGAAFLAGLIAAFFPARYAHLSHLHLLVIGWLPLALWALTRFVRTGRGRYAVGAGVALTIQLLASLHLAIYSTLALGLYLVFLLLFDRQAKARLDRTVTGRLAPAVVVPYLVLLPTLVPHLQAGRKYGFERTREEIAQLAAAPGDYGSVFVTNRLLSNWLPTGPEAFFPGFIALLGVACLVLLRRWSWPPVFAVALTLSAAVLSFGFSVEISGHSISTPYSLVYDWLPPMRNVRGVGRFGLLTGFGFALLAAFGFSAAWTRLRGRLAGRSTVVGLALTLILSLAIGIELRSGVGTADVPDDPERTAVYDWLADQPDGPVVSFPTAGLLHGPFQPVEYMYHSTRHWKPILAGYSGYIPSAHYAVIQHLDATENRPSMVTAENVGLLQDLGIRYVVIHRQPDYDWRTAVQTANELPSLERVAEVSDSVVYRLKPGERAEVELDVGTFAGEVPARAHVNVPVELDNPNPNAAIVHLESDTGRTAEIRWTADDGEVMQQETRSLNLPVVAGAGVTPLALHTVAPETPGTYRLSLTMPESGRRELAERVEVRPPLDTANADTGREVGLALESAVLDGRALRPGSRATIQTTWFVLEPLDTDYTGTVQLFDSDGTMRSQADILLQSQSGLTSAWAPDERVTTRFGLPLPADLPPGEYRLLVAVYDANDPDYPRLPLLLPDNTVATEFWIEELRVAEPD